MSSRNTILFGASLLAAVGAIAVDHATSEAPRPVLAHQEEDSPCAAAIPATSGARSYDDLADDYSGAPAAPAAAPAPAPSPSDGNPCSAGVL